MGKMYKVIQKNSSDKPEKNILMMRPASERHMLHMYSQKPLPTAGEKQVANS